MRRIKKLAKEMKDLPTDKQVKIGMITAAALAACALSGAAVNYFLREARRKNLIDKTNRPL